MYPTPPMTPRPPAFVTAAASSGPAATFILQKRENVFFSSDTQRIVCYAKPGRRTYPAKRMGCLMPNSSVMGVVMVAICEFLERGGEGWLVAMVCVCGGWSLAWLCAGKTLYTSHDDGKDKQAT